MRWLMLGAIFLAGCCDDTEVRNLRMRLAERDNIDKAKAEKEKQKILPPLPAKSKFAVGDIVRLRNTIFAMKVIEIQAKDGEWWVLAEWFDIDPAKMHQSVSKRHLNLRPENEYESAEPKGRKGDA